MEIYRQREAAFISHYNPRTQDTVDKHKGIGIQPYANPLTPLPQYLGLFYRWHPWTLGRDVGENCLSLLTAKGVQQLS